MRIRPAVTELNHSLIREVSEANMGRDGLIKLWFGEPDTATPDFIKNAVTAALADDHVFYAQNRGVPQLCDAISTYVSALHQRPIGTDRVTVSGSGMNAIMLASQALIDQGDNMVNVGPVWPNCRETVHVMGGETRVVSLHPDDGGRWALDLDELLDACDDRTRGIFVNSPGNPTGWVMPRVQQEDLLTAARERGLFIVADEVYVRLAYGTKQGGFVDCGNRPSRREG